MKKATKKTKKPSATGFKLVKAYAVLGWPDSKPMTFGDKKKTYRGVLSIFSNRDDAVGMTTFKDGTRIKSWKVVRCVIAYKQPK